MALFLGLFYVNDTFQRGITKPFFLVLRARFTETQSSQGQASEVLGPADNDKKRKFRISDSDYFGDAFSDRNHENLVKTSAYLQR